MERYDCVLISPASRSINHYRPPLSLIYLGGYLTHMGLSVKIIDITMKNIVRDKDFYRDRDALLGQVRRQQLFQLEQTDSEVYGISCYSPEYEEVCDLIKIIRLLKPKAKIVVGGIHPTLKPKDFAGLADAVVMGEGEAVLYGIVKHGWSGEIFANHHPLNEIAYPDYSLVDMRYYSTPNPYAIRGLYLSTAYISATRGCPSQCAFCVAASLQRFFGINRRRLPGSVAQEIAKLRKDYGFDAVYFIDDTLTTDKKYVDDLCQHLRKMNIVWGCSSKINSIDRALLEEMARSGCVQIDFGVERGSNQALYNIRKHQSVEQIKEVFAMCRKLGIRTFANMLINIPGETTQDYDDILDLLDEIKPSVTSVNVYQEYLGTRLKGKPPTQWMNSWAGLITKRYTSLMDAVNFHASLRYIRILLCSRKKIEYLKNLSNLIREFLNLRS